MLRVRWKTNAKNRPILKVAARIIVIEAQELVDVKR